jgi:SAM-dependent methyltransferase
MPDNRWTQSELAAGYDAGAALIHPYYHELQDLLLRLLPIAPEDDALLVDLGGGSGRLMERLLDGFPKARGLVVDVSAPAIELAVARLSRFGPRAKCVALRLQDTWQSQLDAAPAAIVSMSAIHHLDAAEKQDLYARCFRALRPGGVLLNADEVRAGDDATYLVHCKNWAARMRRLVDAGQVTPGMADALRKWETRNVTNWQAPRASGDDCHETIDAQLAYLSSAGFPRVDCPWKKEMWAVLRGVKG